MTRLPSTWMTAVSGSTRRPSSRDDLAVDLTRPSAISSSAARREATPAWDEHLLQPHAVVGVVQPDIVDRIHFGQQRSDRRQILQ